VCGAEGEAAQYHRVRVRERDEPRTVGVVLGAEECVEGPGEVWEREVVLDDDDWDVEGRASKQGWILHMRGRCTGAGLDVRVRHS
jgi:hypothetical protein